MFQLAKQLYPTKSNLLRLRRLHSLPILLETNEFVTTKSPRSFCRHFTNSTIPPQNSIRRSFCVPHKSLIHLPNRFLSNMADGNSSAKTETASEEARTASNSNLTPKEDKTQQNEGESGVDGRRNKNKRGKRKWGNTKWSAKKNAKKKNAQGKGWDGDGDQPPTKNIRKWKNRNMDRESVHPGSFANAEMRKLFDVSLPELDEQVAKTEEKIVEDQTKSDENVFGASVGDVDKGPSPISDAKEMDQDEKEKNSESLDKKKVTKFPKRKVAILLQFLGTKYAGMQINEGKRTIQAEIELAIFKAGLMTAANFGFPKKYSWSNAARTDKGVHSCAQVCSVKIMVPTDDMNKIREMINEQLPDDICVADVVKVPKSFCARTQRDKARYQYMLPSFALQNSDQLKEAFDSGLGSNHQGRNHKDPFTPAEIRALQQKFREYRATEENIKNLEAALETYEGTRKYHNYTSGKKWDEDSAKRFIISFTVQDRVVDKHGVEWIPTLVIGQSFLLHQIRKMMSMAMDTARGASSLQIMRESFSDKYMNVNTAPAQGLFLDMSYYGNYNKRPHAGDPLDWHTDENAPASLRWKKFKEDIVMGHLMDEEEAQGNFVSYLYQQEHHISFDNYKPVEVKISKR